MIFPQVDPWRIARINADAVGHPAAIDGNREHAGFGYPDSICMSRVGVVPGISGAGNNGALYQSIRGFTTDINIGAEIKTQRGYDEDGVPDVNGVLEVRCEPVERTDSADGHSIPHPPDSSY